MRLSIWLETRSLADLDRELRAGRLELRYSGRRLMVVESTRTTPRQSHVHVPPKAATFTVTHAMPQLHSWSLADE